MSNADFSHALSRRRFAGSHAQLTTYTVIDGQADESWRSVRQKQRLCMAWGNITGPFGRWVQEDS